MALVPFPSQAPAPIPEDDLDADRDRFDEEEDEGAGKMSFLEHLDELRRRIIWAVASVGIGFLAACVFIQRLFDFVMRPIQAMLPPGQTLVYTEPSEAFALYIKIAVIAGLLLASPAVMAQVWLFIAPGLYAHEKKLAIPFVVMSSFFFVLGAAFAHYVVFPMTWRFFASFSTDYVSFMPRIDPTFSLYFKLVISFGVVFQLPTVVLFLARMGLITARWMLRHFKYAVLIIFIAAAVLTPDASPVTQTAMAGPMILLYLVGVALAWMFGKKRVADA